MYPSLLDFLDHILHECAYVLRVQQGKTRTALLDDETLSKAIVRSLEIIGEATKKLPAEFKSQHSHIAWTEMAGMRDVLIHDYFGIDYDVVWNTITQDIPILHEELKNIVETERKK